MTPGGHSIVRMALSLLLGMGMRALSAEVMDNPYQGIVDRNVFNLKPPVDPATLQPPAPLPPKITLTGFTTILGNKRVLFKVQQPPKPPAPATDAFYILSEGQRDGDIEVLEIDAASRAVKFNNHGTIQTLDLADNGVKPPATPMPPPAALTPLPNRAMPGQHPEAPPQGGGMRTIPMRTLRLPPMPGGPGAQPANPPPQAGS